MEAKIDTSAYLNAYLEEAEEILEDLNASLLRLEKEPTSKSELEELFRAAHTLKGMSAAMGITSAAELTHKMENLLDEARGSQGKLTPQAIDWLFDCFDALKKFLENLSQGKESKLEVAALSSSLSFTSSVEASSSKTDKCKKPASGFKTQTVRINTAHLDNLVNLAGELVISYAQLEQALSFIKKADANLDAGLALERLKLVTTDLQEEIMRSRLIRLDNIFDRFPRMVRDTAQSLGKEVSFDTSGGEIELDRAVLDELADLLVHILRNALCHGLEAPKERQSQGKKREGKISLIASREKDHALIEVKDDGRGIDPKKVAKVAAQQRILDAREANSLSDEEAFLLLCQPGLSLSGKTTTLAGRGVGLDVVKGKLDALGGSLEIKSKLGEGTSFFLRLPLTLAIIRALLAKVGNQILAIPLRNTARVISLSQVETKTVQQEKVIVLSNEVIPLVEFSRLFGSPASSSSSCVVIVEAFSKKKGLVVERLLGNREIVVKPLPTALKKVKGIGGATILGDGKVALILDAQSLFKAC